MQCALDPEEADGWRLKLFIQLFFDSLVSQGLDMCIVNCVKNVKILGKH
jgi:hypothetical protein